MTNDWLKRATEVNYTAYDIGCGCYSRKFERNLKNTFKRSARRTAKNSLKKFLTK